ncbi:MAG: TonB C-terminal domain-containing protein [Nevskia sp.]|nr:TonB C-terminal domain-containing protein [Nevskia sp.]
MPAVLAFEEKRSPWRPFGTGLLLLLVGGGAAALIYNLVTGMSGVPKKNVPDVVQLRLIQPLPPPPPPPPPKEQIQQPKEKPPEFKAERQINQPPTPKTETPPGPPALDAQGQGPGDAFGLEGRPGGGDYVGGDGSGGGTRFGWYSAMIENHLREAIERQRKLTSQPYRVPIEVWLAADGRLERVELLRSTGNADLDKLLKNTLGGASRITTPPPKDMQQPVVLTVTSS